MDPDPRVLVGFKFEKSNRETPEKLLFLFFFYLISTTFFYNSLLLLKIEQNSRKEIFF